MLGGRLSNQGTVRKRANSYAVAGTSYLCERCNSAFRIVRASRTPAKSRTSNERVALTGMLLHCDSDGSFFQVLEGEPAALDPLFQKISLDKRHSHVTLIIREPIAKRSFAE